MAKKARKRMPKKLATSREMMKIGPRPMQHSIKTGATKDGGRGTDEMSRYAAKRQKQLSRS